jgi:hypothetical protein
MKVTQQVCIVQHDIISLANLGNIVIAAINKIVYVKVVWWCYWCHGAGDGVMVASNDG